VEGFTPSAMASLEGVSAAFGEWTSTEVPISRSSCWSRGQWAA
jgi:hypothetical protein